FIAAETMILFHNTGPFLFIIFFLMFLLAITANSILIYLIKSQPSLHSPMYVLIGVMAVLDLILPIFFVPNMLLSFLFNCSGISLTGCLIQMFGIHFVGAFQSTLLLWMALDRYFAICKPLNYHKYMEMANFSNFVFVPLIRNGFLMVTMVSLAGKLTFCKNIIDHCLCEHMALVQLACGDISVNNIVGLLSAFIIPTTDFILITISYIVIFTSVFRSGKAHFKAINTCITHISYDTYNRTFMSIIYILFPSCFNPIIYGWRTKEIRQTFHRFIKKRKAVFVYKGTS
uniref:G-protein coupled receptors family 1 profile domain-containing protein n=1 Tax=Sinocyclocheilus anshuiensis TaxID=1608454 RepID=A0A671P7K3_9TELE